MRIAALHLLPVAALPAQAQQWPKDLEMLKKYAGSWTVDCSRAVGTRLTVEAKSLSLSAGGKQLRTGAPLAAFSCFGKMEPPHGFDVALLGEGWPIGLSLLARKDNADTYLTVDADPPQRKQIGDKALAGKFRPCP